MNSSQQTQPTLNCDNSSAPEEELPKSGANESQHIENNDKNIIHTVVCLNNQRNGCVKEVPNRVCYDNPAFAGINFQNVSHEFISNGNGILNVGNGVLNTVNDNPNPNPNPNHTLIALSSNSTEKSYDNHSSDKIFKERTLSMSSVKSFKNAVADRRCSRKVSIARRKMDLPGGDLDNIDENPLRRKMSFIRDTSGEEPLRTAAIQILLASLMAGIQQKNILVLILNLK